VLSGTEQLTDHAALVAETVVSMVPVVCNKYMKYE